MVAEVRPLGSEVGGPCKITSYTVGNYLAKFGCSVLYAGLSKQVLKTLCFRVLKT